MVYGVKVYFGGLKFAVDGCMIIHVCDRYKNSTVQGAVS